MKAHEFKPDEDGDCLLCPHESGNMIHVLPEPLPVLPYAGTSGWSGSDTSMERAVDADNDGTTSARQATTLRHLGFVGSAGATWKELGEAAGWHHGQSSGVLSVLHKEGRVARLTERRSRCQVYVLPSNVNDRETVPHGRRKAADVVALIDAACAFAVGDSITGADHYYEPVIPVSVLRAIIAGEPDA